MRFKQTSHLICTQIFVVFALIVTGIAQTASASEVALQDSKALVSFDSESGALTRLEDKTTHWVIERRPELGVSFRLHAPLPDRRDNFVLGQKQKAVEVKKLSENKVMLKWKDLISEHGGVLPMTLTAYVTLENGVLTFDALLVNDSALSVETIEYPYFGDFNPPTRETPMRVRTMWYGNLQSDEINPSFGNEKGYWGVLYPTKTFDSNRSLFSLIQAPKQGLYVQMGDPNQRYLMQYTFELHPGNSFGAVVPQQDDFGDYPVHLEFRATHFVFAAPHSATNLVPVVVTVYQGDWHAGVDLYKKWRATWFKQAHIPDWLKDVHSWLQLQINSPEQDYRVPYTEVVRYAKECAKNGVKAIQLVGWNREGQDGNDPSQDTDPGLGTWQQLHDAIAQSQALGVRMILFGKLNWADKTTQWYKDELYKYAATDPYGIAYEQGGYSYFTPTQLAGINTHRRAVMDFASPAYRDIATKEFRKVLALDASGWLFDENCHHAGVKYSFAPDHGYKTPGYIYGGDMPMAAQLRAAADRVNRDFVFAGEGHMDWLMQYYPISYFRIANDSTPVDRYIDPQASLMVAVTGFDDREKLNLVLLDRYIISYEPFNFKGHVTDFPSTLAYGKKIDDLRRKYKAYLWDADFRDTLGATVTSNGVHRYSVFVTTEGKRAVVVVNQESTKPITARVELPNASHLVVATPEQPESRSTSGVLEIPARSAAVVMEQ